jgi:hypothetical protein
MPNEASLKCMLDVSEMKKEWRQLTRYGQLILILGYLRTVGAVLLMLGSVVAIRAWAVEYFLPIYIVIIGGIVWSLIVLGVEPLALFLDQKGLLEIKLEELRSDTD